MSNVIKIALLFILAILVALIVRTVVASASHPKVVAIETEKVRVSAADLPQGLLLRDADLEWKDMPVGNVPQNAIIEGAQNANGQNPAAQSPADVKGALLRHPIAAGTPITVDDVILPSAPGFLAATLKPDMRAVSVAIDDVSGNAGLIQPGDYVDLLLTQSMDRRTDAPDLAVSSETVVQQVRVLAVGSEISRPKSANGNGPDANVAARTVTLEVTPHMGESIAVAARLGSLSLALRSFAKASRDDAAASDTLSASASAPVWAGDISRAVRELPHAHAAPVAGPAAAPAAAPAPRTVMIYRGSDRADASSSLTADSGVGTGAPPLPVGTAAQAGPQPH
ncbi:Flp pilus assembly protein CpaB [Paraburkholderia phosphatilytica]|uniref:Flp pilus assembly protein CpaB n=1 Tax=Paraburkholderia phosphatilytica TaxID=2282883 RepID=UPI000E517A7A|nr:Flp pilus assembly protein CpaB [Paraburkholderia phosphatilytica]